MKKILKIMLIATFVMATLLTCLVGAAHLYLLTDQGRRFLLEAVNTLYPGKITGSTIEASLLTQDVSLDNAVLRGPDGKQVLKARHVYLKINLPALLKYDVVFEVINADEPEFVLELDKDGRLNIESAFAEDTPEISPFNLYIRSLNCRNGRFEYHGLDGKPIVRLDGFDLHMKSAFEMDTSITLAVNRAAMALFIADRKIDLGYGSASCSIFNDRISDIRITTRKGSSAASLTGSITAMARKAQLLCRLDVDADAADISMAMGLAPEETGRITGSITAMHDYDDPELEAALRYSGGTLAGLSVARAELEGSITRRLASIRKLRAGFASGTLDASGTIDLSKLFPEGYFDGMKEEDTLSYDLLITGTSLLMDDIPGMPEGLRGRISTRAELKGSGISADTARLNAVFDADCRGVNAAEFFRGDDLFLKGSLSYRKDALDIRSLNARALGATASSLGKIDLAAGDIKGTISIDSPDVRDLFRRLDMDASGALKATMSLSGTTDRPSADISAHADSARLSDIVLGSVDMRAILGRDGRLAVSSCSISNRSSSIQARGSIQVFGKFPALASTRDMEVNADMMDVNPSDFLRHFPLTGSVSGHVITEGPVDDLEAGIRLTGRGMSYEGIPLGDALLNAELSQGLLTVSQLDLSHKNSRLSLAGDAAIFDHGHKRFSSDPDIHLSVRGENIQLEDFSSSVKGSLRLSATMEGSLLHPIGDAELSCSGLDLGFQKFTSLEAKIQADGGRFWIEPAILSLNPGENINGSGWISTDGKYAVTIGTQGLSLESLDFMKQLASTKGLLFLNVSGEGSLSNPTLAGRISATNVMFDSKPLDDLTLGFELIDNKVSVQGNWNFSLKAQHDLSTDDFSTTVIFAETELNPYFIISGKPNFSGRLTGRIDATGNTGSLKNIDLTADIASLDMLHANKVLVQGRNLSGSFKHGELFIPQSRFSFGDKGWLDLSGSGHLNRSMTLDVQGIIPVDVLGLFSEDLSESSGIIRVSSRTTAQGSQAVTSGLLNLEDIAYTIPANGQRLHTVNGRVLIDGSRLIIEEITGRLDTGSFRIGGSLTHEGFVPESFDLEASAKSLPVVIPDMMELNLDAEATLSSSGRRSLLKSDVIILDGVYTRDVRANLLTGVLERIIPRQKTATEKSPAADWPFASSLDLDVTVKRRGEMKVENNIADLALNPDLRITGTLALPVVTGRVTVTEGVVNFQNNEFTVSRGLVDFLNPYRTVPTVDIKGSTRVRDWSIDLTLEGDLDNLEIKLDSSPPEEPADILSLLVVGKTSRELTQSQSGVTVSPAAMAAEMLASTYGGELKKATTLDILEVKASEFSTSDSGQNLKLTLGKELSRKLTLRYQVETRNAETIQRGIAEYKIFENLIVNGYQGSDGIFGADIQLKYEFR